MRERLNRHVNASQLVRFPFRHDTPGLTEGVPVYTPTPGDLLLDAWFAWTQGWNGTSPLADIGTFVGGATQGIFQHWLNAVAASVTDNDAGWGTLDGVDGTNGPGSGAGVSLATLSAILNVGSVYTTPASPGSLVLDFSHPLNNWTRVVPARFKTIDPLKVVVSQDGTAGGADPGATQGEATLHLLLIPA